MLSATVHVAGNLDIAEECAQKKIAEAPTSAIRSRFSGADSAVRVEFRLACSL